MNLDRLDRKILLALDENARQPLSAIAKKVRLGSDLVEYRVRKLLDEGIIRHFSAQIDSSKLGLGVYKTFIRRKNNQKRNIEFINYLNKNDSTHWISEWYGQWDLIFSLTAKSAKDFQVERNKIFQIFSDEIISFDTAVSGNIMRYSKGYLLDKEGIELPYGHSEETVRVDELELKILNILSTNARISYLDLAENLSSTPAIIKYRIEKLEKLKVIAGYRLQLDYSNSSQLVFKLLISPATFNPKLADEIEMFCKLHPNITCFISQLANYSFEIEAEVSHYNEFHSLIDKFRATFDSKIKSVEHLLLRRDHFHRISRSAL